jgi:hypothetical protein
VSKLDASEGVVVVDERHGHRTGSEHGEPRRPAGYYRRAKGHQYRVAITGGGFGRSCEPTELAWNAGQLAALGSTKAKKGDAKAASARFCEASDGSNPPGGTCRGGLSRLWDATGWGMGAPDPRSH